MAAKAFVHLWIDTAKRLEDGNGRRKVLNPVANGFSE